MSVLEWAVLGAVFLGIMIFCARIMRRGLTTLDDDRRQYLEKIREGERKIAEDRKNIPALDQLSIMRAALEDLIRLDGNPEGFEVRPNGRILEFLTPDGSWKVELVMREQSLRSTHRVLHGRSRWLLTGFDLQERHPDPASLMRSLNSHIHSCESAQTEPPHIAKRLAGMEAVSHKIHG